MEYQLLTFRWLLLIFGRKKLSVEPMKVDVDEDTELLRILASTPSLTAPQLVANIFRNVARQFAAGTLRFGDVRPLLEFISAKIPEGWLLLSELHEDSRDDTGLESAKAAVKSYLEATPRTIEQLKAWERLAALCERTDDFLGVADAEASLCELPGVSLRRMSNAASHLLTMLRSGPYLARPFEYRRKVKQTILRIVAMMAGRESECTVTDFTRLAWLSLVANDEVAARQWTERGLAMEAENVHCLSLAQRLGIRAKSQAAPKLRPLRR